MIPQVIGQRNWIMCVGGKPRLSGVEPSAQFSGVIIQDNVFAIDAAGQASPGDFHFSRFVSGYPGVGDCDAPEAGGSEAGRGGRRIHVSGFVAHFIWDVRVVDDYERKRAADPPLRSDHDDAGGRDLVGNDYDETFRRD